MKPEPKLTFLGLICIVIAFFVFLGQLHLGHEFPKNLVGMFILIVLGLVLMFIDSKVYGIKEEMQPSVLMLVFAMVSIATYGSYTEYKQNHFFDNHEIVECDKDISKCTYGVHAINPKDNFFFCATVKDGDSYLGDMELNPLKCSWREKQ